MATVKKDYRGLRGPVPVLKLNSMFVFCEVRPGDLVEVQADCPSFESDLKKLCANWRKTLVGWQSDGLEHVAVIMV